MILYFSGTGNSRIAAQLLAKDLGDALISINDIFKSEAPWVFHSETPFVLVSPIYAWRLPERIETFLEKATFDGSRKLYIVATMGVHAGCAEIYCQKIAEHRGMDFMGFAGIPMPDNYLVSGKALNKEDDKEKIQAALPRLHEIGKLIRYRRSLPLGEGYTKKDHLLSGLVNWSFSHFMINSHAFSVSETCLACGRCAKNCPMNNIVLEDGNIRFGQRCMFCMGCINCCPVHAIDHEHIGGQHAYYSAPLEEEIG